MVLVRLAVGPILSLADGRHTSVSPGRVTGRAGKLKAKSMKIFPPVGDPDLCTFLDCRRFSPGI